MRNLEFLRVAHHWSFTPRACRPYRAQTKGKVERPVRYLRDNFVYGRSFTNDADLDQQRRQWLDDRLGIRTPLDCVGEMTLRKCAAGAGFEVSLEARRGPSIEKLHLHQNAPGPVVDGLSRRTLVVPSNSLVYVRGTTYIVTRWIALTSEDVDESLTNAFHDGSRGISRASENAEDFVRRSRLETGNAQLVRTLPVG